LGAERKSSQSLLLRQPKSLAYCIKQTLIHPTFCLVGNAGLKNKLFFKRGGPKYKRGWISLSLKLLIRANKTQKHSDDNKVKKTVRRKVSAGTAVQKNDRLSKQHAVQSGIFSEFMLLYLVSLHRPVRVCHTVCVSSFTYSPFTSLLFLSVYI